jgi:multiple sugar transport system permease protein
MGYAAAAGYVLTAVMLVLAGFYMRLAFKKGI